MKGKLCVTFQLISNRIERIFFIICRKWLEWLGALREGQREEKNRLFESILRSATDTNDENMEEENSRVARIPFMITKSMMKTLVEDMNYPRRLVNSMTPSEAQYIIKNNIKHKPPPRTVFNADVSAD